MEYPVNSKTIKESKQSRNKRFQPIKISTSVLLLLSLFTSYSFANNNIRATYNFNYEWKVFVGDDENASAASFNDSSWKPVSLPHSWNEDEAFKNDIKDLSTGIAWYRKTFKVPEKHQNQKVFIEFEGVRHAAEVYINGNYVGIHENGIMAFGFD
ncbi:MAG: beta galactosidase jelly roll domain-containing protein, partial [Prolixibacteraceae bacterium]|nr:beta galactosidase jelly roll domain-containing protein [Prolixibacteraceae bacterium]